MILSEKAGYDAEIKDIKNKYFTTYDYNKFTNNILDAKITAKALVNESGLNEKSSYKRRNKTITSKGKIKSRAR